jgi:hypothetical protein
MPDPDGYRGRHRHDEMPDADKWRIRLYISRTNLPHTAEPKHGKSRQGVI